MLTLEDIEELKDMVERARQGSPFAMRVIAYIKQKARDDDPTCIEQMAEIRRLALELCNHNLKGEWCTTAHFVRGILQPAHRRCVRCGEFVNVYQASVSTKEK